MTIGEMVAIGMAALALARVVFTTGQAHTKQERHEKEIAALKKWRNTTQVYLTSLHYDVRDQGHELSRLRGKEVVLHSATPPPRPDDWDV